MCSIDFSQSDKTLLDQAVYTTTWMIWWIQKAHNKRNGGFLQRWLKWIGRIKKKDKHDLQVLCNENFCNQTKKNKYFQHLWEFIQYIHQGKRPLLMPKKNKLFKEQLRDPAAAQGGLFCIHLHKRWDCIPIMREELQRQWKVHLAWIQRISIQEFKREDKKTKPLPCMSPQIKWQHFSSVGVLVLSQLSNKWKVFSLRAGKKNFACHGRSRWFHPTGIGYVTTSSLVKKRRRNTKLGNEGAWSFSASWWTSPGHLALVFRY